MSDSRQFIAVMIIAALFVSWLGWRGFVVMELNDMKLRQRGINRAMLTPSRS